MFGLLCAITEAGSTFPEWTWVRQGGGAAPPSYWTDPVSRRAHYNFEATNTTATLDVSGNHFNATNMPNVSSGPTWLKNYATNSLGRAEGVYQFDGSDDGFKTQPLLVTGAVKRTYCLWFYCIKNDASIYQYIFDSGELANYLRDGCYIRTDAKSIHWGIYGGTVTNAGSFTTNVWTHLALVYDGGNWVAPNIHIYFNGVAKTALSGVAVAPSTTSSPHSFAYDYLSTAYPWKGYWDDIRVYKGTNLTQTEIQTIMAKTHPTNNIELR